MRIDFKKIEYMELNDKQKEAFNYQKLSAVLADFGFVTIPLSNDWNGADFILQCKDGVTYHNVQLKSRLTFDKKYCDKQLYICFRDGIHDCDPWYIYDHDELLKKVSPDGRIEKTKTWADKKPYHFPTLSPDLRGLLKPYQIPKLI